MYYVDSYYQEYSCYCTTQARNMVTRKWIVTGLLFSILISLLLSLIWSPSNIQRNLHLPWSAPSLSRSIPTSMLEHQKLCPKYLSYQPPGNGWNNQRIVLENALVMAKLLNRTLVVHPLAPHELGNKLRQHYHFGYETYNSLETSDLLPLSSFLNLPLLSKLLPIVEIQSSHPQFKKDYSNLTWKGVCHSPWYGFWVDEEPQLPEEADQLARQKFTRIGHAWKESCKNEKSQYEKHLIQQSQLKDASKSQAMIKFVSDLAKDEAQMLYFEEGSLFRIQIRFLTHKKALAAQHWVTDHVQYKYEVWERVNVVIQKLGGRKRYNAIHIRRGDHSDRNFTQSFWIERMVKNFSKELPVYVATDDKDPLWFQPFVNEGFKLYFRANFADVLSFNDVKENFRDDYLGIHEQCLCEAALHFVPSPQSTFSAFILRRRGDVPKRDGLLMDTLRTFWVGQTQTEKN